MKLKLYKILTVIFIILSFSCGYYTSRYFTEKYNISDTIVKVDSIIIAKDNIVKIPYKVSEKLPPDTFFIQLDSSDMVNRYKTLSFKLYAQNEFLDTLKLDTIGKVYVRSFVSKNNLDSTLYSYYVNSYQKETKIFVKDKNSLYIGGLVGMSNLGPSVTYLKNQKYGYTVGCDVLTKSVNVGFSVKIKSW